MKKYIPLVIILILIGFAYFFGLADYFSFEVLKQHRQTLTDFVSKHPILAPITFISVYAVTTALSIPTGIYLSIFSGFLFPQPYCTIYVVIGASIGATIVFLIAKTAFGDTLREKAGASIQKMQKGFQENAAGYLLFLRLVPAFPFWLVNIAPAFFGVPLRTFVWTTIIGIIPGVFVFAQAGTGLAAIFDKGEEFNLETVFNTDVKIALVALGVFAIMPTVIQFIRKRYSKTET